MNAIQRDRRRAPARRFGLILAVVLVPAGAALAQTGGLYLPENGGPSNGTAQAGSAAVARDAETAWTNPAGMTRLETTELMFSLMPFALDFSFNAGSATTVGGPDGGNQGTWLPGAALYFATPLNERVALGFSVTSPGGLIIDPSDDWVGRSWTTRSKLIMLNFEPSIGVRLNEQWSIGGGVDIQYINFEQDLRGPLSGAPLGIDGDSWDVGFSLSVLWEPLETTRVGVRYRSQIDHTLGGDLTVTTGRPIGTSFTTPMSVTMSGYHEFSPKFALLADFGWTDWSAFDSNVISFDNSGAAVTLPRNFRDTWSISVGAHVRPAERWLILFGGGYVSSAVSDENRTPDLPVDEQVRVSLGVEYEINERWSVGGSYTFIWLGDNTLDQTRNFAGRIAGDYDATAHMLAVYGAVRF